MRIKRLSSVLLVAIAATVLALPANAQITTDPSGAPLWWEQCPGPTALADWGANTSGSPPNTPGFWYSSWPLDPNDWDIIVAGLNVEVRLKNAKIQENAKHLYVYIQGTSAGGAPTVTLIRGDNGTCSTDDVPCDAGTCPGGQTCVGDKADSVLTGSVTGSAAGTNWTVAGEARFVPQPDWTIVRFTMPTGGVITHAWAGDCCLDKDIPAVSTWGLAVMLLLVAAAGTIVVTRARARAVGV